ncbi:hypothetical protein [Clostridium cellulovorans]|uniref:hypothetical protein n=1 Tax=Clostridium cellulovorans TaxID=1493 RepID=UPI0001E8EE3F|nr:hypothetical protein [Clostridium cellulovorans]
MAVGGNGNPILSTSQPYKNLKLCITSIKSPPFDANSSCLSIEPLVEPIHQLASLYPSPYPYNIHGETPHSSMENQVSALVLEMAGIDYITAHTVVNECSKECLPLKRSIEHC